MDAETVSVAARTAASGLVWVYRFLDDGTAVSVPCEDVEQALAESDGWTWVHLGLADARARMWIAQHAPLSDMARDVLTGTDEHIRLDIHGAEIAGVLPDLQQSLVEPTDDIVRLRFTMQQRLLVTARRSPVHSVELTRRSIDTGRLFPEPISLLDAVIDQFADAIGRLTDTIGDQLDTIENALLSDELGDERVQLGRIRLQLVRMHRQLAQLSMLFHRIEPRVERELRDMSGPIRALAQKLDAIDQDVMSQHERARLLLDEVTGKMAAITNRRLFTLSMLTACLLPPTLVTGFFGMNTKDLPFQATDEGTWYAFAFAAAAGAVTFWILTRLRAL